MRHIGPDIITHFLCPFICRSFLVKRPGAPFQVDTKDVSQRFP